MGNEGRRASPEADYDDASAVTKLAVEAVAPRGDSRAGRRAGLEKCLMALTTAGVGV